MKKIPPALLTLVLLISTPATVAANMGTPLMWASMLHLYIGNTIIGIIEGLVIARVFRTGHFRSVCLLIAANYFSAWLGVFVTGAVSSHLQIDLYNFKAILAAMVLGTYFFTLIVEWPFVAFCFRRTAGWIRRSLLANLLAQSVTYLLLLAWYGLASGTSFITSTNIVSLSDLRLPEKVYCHYISAEDGDVYSRNLSSANEKKIFHLNSSHSWDRLFARPVEGNPEQLEIVASTEGNDRLHPSFSVVESLEGQGPHYTTTGVPPLSHETISIYIGIGEAPRLGSAQVSEWCVSTGSWSIDDMHGINNKTGQKFRFYLETPFLNWPISDAVHLPQDMILFQLGRDQICLLEIETRRIALVTRGWGPVAVLVKKP